MKIILYPVVSLKKHMQPWRPLTQRSIFADGSQTPDEIGNFSHSWQGVFYIMGLLNPSTDPFFCSAKKPFQF